jgi:hypothetical protein
MCDDPLMTESLYDEISRTLAAARAVPLPEIPASLESGAAIGETIREFVLREANALEAVVLRLAREIDALRGTGPT